MISTSLIPRFGEILFADVPMLGSVQGGRRPVLVVQNDKGNAHSTMVEVLPISAKVLKAHHLPTHVFIRPDENTGLMRDSVILAENVITIPMSNLVAPIGFVDEKILRMVAKARYIQSPLPFHLT